jgi:hypothetical protein
VPAIQEISVCQRCALRDSWAENNLLLNPLDTIAHPEDCLDDPVTFGLPPLDQRVHVSIARPDVQKFIRV